MFQNLVYVTVGFFICLPISLLLFGLVGLWQGLDDGWNVTQKFIESQLLRPQKGKAVAK